MTTPGHPARRPLIDPDSAVVAFCAPGLSDYATRLLECRGETVSEVRESQYMTGRTDIILVADPVFPLPPFEHPWADPDYDVAADLRACLAAHWRYGL